MQHQARFISCILQNGFVEGVCLIGASHASARSPWLWDPLRYSQEPQQAQASLFRGLELVLAAAHQLKIGHNQLAPARALSRKGNE